jgi:hypothetical protein
MESQFAPALEAYLPPPKFKYAPDRREVDFAQLMAVRCDPVKALTLSNLVTEEEAQTRPRAQLYAMATRLLSTPAVQERLDYYLLLHQASMSISVERVEQELAAVAFSDFAQLFHKSDGPTVTRPDQFSEPDPETGRQPLVSEPAWRAGEPIRNPHDLPRPLRAAIKEWRFDKDGCLVAKFHDKLSSIKLLSEMEGYLDEANRAKAPQINISIGDGKGTAPRLAAKEAVVIEAAVAEPLCLDCLD